MKQKKSRLGLFALIFIALLVIGGVASQSFSVDSTVKSGGFISAPTWGYFACEEDSNRINTGLTTFNFINLNCKSAGDTLAQSCDVVLKTPSAEQVKGVEEAVLLYAVCTEGESCNILSGEKVAERIVIRNAFITKSEHVNQEVSKHLEKNQFLVAAYQEKSGIFSSSELVDGKSRYSLYLNPFRIYKYDVFSNANGLAVSDTRDCVYNDGSIEANFIIEDVRGGGVLSSQLQESEILDMSRMRSANVRSTFISNFVGVVPQYTLFDDDSKYCYDKTIYDVVEIETVGGTYKVADRNYNSALKTVDCCNDGDVRSGYTCVDFEEVPLSSSEGSQCSAFNPCPLNTWTSVVGSQMAVQECVSGVCVTEFEKVDCSFNEDCVGGYCDVDYSNPSNNECVALEIISSCGNNVCEYSFGETVQSCPQDCSYQPPKDFTWMYILGGFVLVILLMFLIKSNMKRGKK